MKKNYLVLAMLISSAGIVCADEKASETVVPRCHEHAVEPTEKITNPVFLEQDEAKKEASLHLIATFDASNYGMNFNGVFKSMGGYEIPLGYTVKVKFCNNSAVPHSVMVVDAADAERKINLGDEPYFPGACTPNPNTTGTTTKIETFEFVADEAGEFALACGFPTHSLSGHRIFLKIKKDLAKAAFVVPEK